MAQPMTHFAGSFPACFDSLEQFEEWQHWAKLSEEMLFHAGPCTDCTPRFQQEMIMCKRCENPAVEFKLHPVKMWGKRTGYELRGFIDKAYANQEKV